MEQQGVVIVSEHADTKVVKMRMEMRDAKDRSGECMISDAVGW